ncbi:MAG: dihydroneopterin aldolase [Bacteroidota bacterium]
MRNAVFYAYHGAMTDEQTLGGKFECDVEMFCDLSAAADSDSLKKTVDYEKVYAYIQRVLLERKYHLIEALANAVARGLLGEFHAVERVIVRVRKPHPPVRGVVDYIEVETSLTR